MKKIQFGISLLLALLFVVTSVIPAGAASAVWSTEAILDPAYGGYITPHVAVNARGAAAVVWDQLDQTTFLNQVAVAVTSRTGWKPTVIISDPNVDSTNLGVVITPAGKVMVFWSAAGVLTYSLYNGIAWSLPQAIPADAGYTYFAGAGVDSLGNIQVALGSQQPTAPVTFLVETVVMTAQGVWKPPVVVTTVNPMGYPRMIMNSSGKALLVGGFISYYSSRTGSWGAEKIIPVTGGQIFATDAALDVSGRAYFIYRTHYNGFYLSTSTPTASWTAPLQVPQFDTLGSEIHIVGSGSGRAVIFGTDYTNGEIYASVTTNSGATWSLPVSFGPIMDIPVGTASANGVYAITWNDGLDMKVAVGSGIGAGTRAWMVKTLASNYAEGAVALNGTRAVSAWWRATDPMYTAVVIGASTGLVGP